MTVIDVTKDRATATMTMTCEFDAAPEAVWQLWADPRKLERWWGPPTYPATVHEHELVAGGKVTYTMTGPEGDTHGGWWKVIAVEAPRRLEFEDGFSRDDGTPNLDLPVTQGTVTFEALDGGRTRMLVHSTFPSAEAMDQMAAMGMEEGMTLALGQMDALLAA